MSILLRNCHLLALKLQAAFLWAGLWIGPHASNWGGLWLTARKNWGSQSGSPQGTEWCQHPRALGSRSYPSWQPHPHQHLHCSLAEDSAMPRMLHHKNCDIINIPCFKLLSLTTENEYILKWRLLSICSTSFKSKILGHRTSHMHNMNTVQDSMKEKH